MQTTLNVEWDWVNMIESLSPNLNDPSVHIPKFTNDHYSSTMGFYTVS
jgi:hypothetical protein